MEQEGGRMRGEDRYSCMTGSREDDRDLETHASESRILDRGDLHVYNYTHNIIVIYFVHERERNLGRQCH